MKLLVRQIRDITVLNNGGALAQLVERVNGIDEVSGSNPLSSTIS